MTFLLTVLYICEKPNATDGPLCDQMNPLSDVLASFSIEHLTEDMYIVSLFRKRKYKPMRLCSNKKYSIWFKTKDVSHQNNHQQNRYLDTTAST